MSFVVFVAAAIYLCKLSVGYHGDEWPLCTQFQANTIGNTCAVTLKQSATVIGRITGSGKKTAKELFFSNGPHWQSTKGATCFQ